MFQLGLKCLLSSRSNRFAGLQCGAGGCRLRRLRGQLSAGAAGHSGLCHAERAAGGGT